MPKLDPISVLLGIVLGMFVIPIVTAKLNASRAKKA